MCVCVCQLIEFTDRLEAVREQQCVPREDKQPSQNQPVLSAVVPYQDSDNEAAVLAGV